jgi:hypothetical protein
LTKKGQDLTKPGEKDDFMDILHKQMEELREKYEKQERERGKGQQKRQEATSSR